MDLKAPPHHQVGPQRRNDATRRPRMQLGTTTFLMQKASRSDRDWPFALGACHQTRRNGCSPASGC
jgi:hypothetical protein